MTNRTTLAVVLTALGGLLTALGLAAQDGLTLAEVLLAAGGAFGSAGVARTAGPPLADRAAARRLMRRGTL